jgi:hypothetical protein
MLELREQPVLVAEQVRLVGHATTGVPDPGELLGQELVTRGRCRSATSTRKR